MRLCIIPDLHNRVEIAEKIIEKENNSVDQFILLGDYFDNFFDGPEDVTKAANFLKLYCNDPKFKFLYSVMWNDQRIPTFFSECKWHDLEVISESR